MSILVTGAAGFIGCNNVLALNARGRLPSKVILSAPS